MPESVQVRPSQTTSAPIRADRIDERLVDGELVLYDSRRQRVHALNPTAAFVWRACDGRHDEAGIIAELSELYPDSLRAIEADVPELLELFRGEGLLEI